VNWAFVASGSLALLGSAIHGIVGDRIVRGLDSAALGGRPRFLIRVTWHFTTIAFAVLGVALVFVGVTPDSGASTGVAYGAGALFSCWSAFALIAGFMRGGLRGWLSHPAPFMLSITAALIWWGGTQL
jgi:hypothetical protein